MAKKPDKDRARLQALIEEATADCYGEGEEHAGIVNMIEENLVHPFKARVIGEEVEVVEVTAPKSGFGVDVVCRYKGKDYRLDISALEWPTPKPAGYEWVEAFEAWRATLG